MKSLLGAGALVLAMVLGAWSSDAFHHGDDQPDKPAKQGQHEKSYRPVDGTSKKDAKD